MEYKTSSSTLVTAAGFIIITAALLQANRHSVLAVPFKRQTRHCQTTDPYPLHEQVFNGLKIFTEVAKHTLQLDTLNEAKLPLCDEIIQQINNSVKERTVCSMYNLYLNFIALKNLTSSEEERTNLTSNEIIVKSVMDSSYMWNLSQNATLEDIYRLCFPYELCKAYKLRFNVKKYGDGDPGDCKTDWMNRMLPENNSTSTEAIDLIVQHAECTELENASSSCRYSCADCAIKNVMHLS